MEKLGLRPRTKNSTTKKPTTLRRTPQQLSIALLTSLRPNTPTLLPCSTSPNHPVATNTPISLRLRLPLRSISSLPLL